MPPSTPTKVVLLAPITFVTASATALNGWGAGPPPTIKFVLNILLLNHMLNTSLEYSTNYSNHLILCLFIAPLAIFQLSGGCHHYRWQGCKFRPMLSTQGLWAGRGTYRATPTATRASVYTVSSERPARMSHSGIPTPDARIIRSLRSTL
jgi:hypothetical protein